MYEIFGFGPLIKVFIILTVLIYTSFFLGSLISNRHSNNSVIHFLVGLSTIVSLMALIITMGKTVFIPFILFLFIYFPPSLPQQITSVFKISLKNSLWLITLVGVFLIQGIFRFDYFSDQFVHNAYSDFSFYLMVAESLLKTGIESPYNYLSLLDVSVAPSIYHFYDIYLIAIPLLFGIPPLLAYLFLFLPLMSALICFISVQFFPFKEHRWIAYFIVYVAMHAATIDISTMEIDISNSIIYSHKSAFTISLFFILYKWYESKRQFLLIFAVLLSFLFNPLFLLITIGVIVFIFIVESEYFLDSLKRKNLTRSLILFGLTAGYYLVFFKILRSKQSDDFLVDVSREGLNILSLDYLVNVSERFFSYLFSLKFYPFIVLAVIIELYNYIRCRKITPYIYLVFIFFFIGNLLNGLFFFHIESFQFFAFSLFLLSFITVLYCLYKALSTNIVLRFVGLFSLIIVFYSFLLSDFKNFYTPLSSTVMSLEYAKESYNLLEENEKVLYFKNIPNDNKELHWRTFQPHLNFGMGALKLRSNIILTKPIAVEMLQGFDNLPVEAIMGIRSGSYQLFCDSAGYNPLSYSDREFEEATTKFIQKHHFTALLFDKEVEIPNWVYGLQVKKEIRPKKEYDTFVLLKL